MVWLYLRSHWLSGWATAHSAQGKRISCLSISCCRCLHWARHMMETKYFGRNTLVVSRGKKKPCGFKVLITNDDSSPTPPLSMLGTELNALSMQGELSPLKYAFHPLTLLLSFWNCTMQTHGSSFKILCRLVILFCCPTHFIYVSYSENVVTTEALSNPWELVIIYCLGIYNKGMVSTLKSEVDR